MGGVAILLNASIASAAPLAPRPVEELLGLRPGTTATQFTSAAPVSNHQAPARRSYATTTGETGAAAAKINASVVYPDNVAGMWSYSTTEWNPTRLATGILATGGGFAAKGYYYINRYIEVMGLEEIKTINYNLSDWSEYDSYTGYIQYVATTMAYNPLGKPRLG